MHTQSPILFYAPTSPFLDLRQKNSIEGRGTQKPDMSVDPLSLPGRLAKPRGVRAKGDASGLVVGVERMQVNTPSPTTTPANKAGSPGVLSRAAKF